MTVDEEPPYAIHVLGRVDERTFKMSRTGHLDPAERGARSGGVCPAGQADQPRGLREQSTRSSITATSGPPFWRREPGVSTPVKQISRSTTTPRPDLKGLANLSGAHPGSGVQPGALQRRRRHTLAVLNNNWAGNAGVAVGSTLKLPVLTPWKNTDTGPGAGPASNLVPAMPTAPSTWPSAGPLRSSRGDQDPFDLTYRLLQNADRSEAGPGPGGERSRAVGPPSCASNPSQAAIRRTPSKKPSEHNAVQISTF